MKINWTNEKRKVSELVPADYNPRTLSEKERADLVESIKEFNEVEPVIVNKNNTLIGGHQRVSIYADLGIEEIDVRVPSRTLSIDEEMRLNLRLNKNTGSWDWAALSTFDKDLLESVGFTDEDMMVNFGLSDAEEQDIDLERMQVLAVYPPEAPKLKEKMALHFESIEDYRKVKKAIEDGKLTEDLILKMI